MSGWICDSKCVKQDAGKASCDASCAEKGGDTVFVDDQGKATKIANPKMTTTLAENARAVHNGQKVLA
jgi:hypothetical protein